MPRSRSSSLLSMARSATRSLARKVPLWCSSASTSVVLPWSTCAMMATLRRSGLATSDLPGWEEGFSTDKDILPVYRDQGPGIWAQAQGSGLRAFREPREDFLRAIAELLVVHHLVRVLPRFRRLREVVVGDGDVEPRRRQIPAALGD